jgi:peptidoglycan/LPS O-acetylase OafA/YrhL
MLIFGARSLRAWLLNLTVFSSIEAGIPQAWSLRVEECFYLCAPFLFFLWRRHPVLPLGIWRRGARGAVPLAKVPALDGIVGSAVESLSLHVRRTILRVSTSGSGSPRGWLDRARIPIRAGGFRSSPSSGWAASPPSS